jgi:hypothetical protein
MNIPFWKSKVFWTLIAGVLAFVVKNYFPSIEITDVQILAAIVIVLGSFNITPELRARGLMADG